LYTVAVMDDVDEVVAWRTPEHDRIVWMAGRTTGYRVDPVGEYVVGVATSTGYRLRRGRERQVVDAGRLVVLDPSTKHEGAPVATTPWTARLLVLELDGDGLDVAFPDPYVGDPGLARRFVDLHELSRSPASMLERESTLAEFLDDLVAASPAARRTPASADRPAVARALAHLRAHVADDVGLDDLSAVAGVSKFHLVRQFREVTGLPPHAFQIGLRIVRARRLLESRVPTAEVAARTGFVDQSHLHRHFRRRLGITPGRYAAAFASR
jgi:AraC-like DNA-binding protein